MVFNAIASINLWAVFAAAAFGFVFAGIYFGVVTPKHYAVVLGRKNTKTEKPSALFILGPFLCNVVMIVTSAVIMRLVGPGSLGDALALGALIGIGFLMTMCLTIAINPNFPKPFAYTALNAPYFIVNILVIHSVLYFLR